MEKADILERAKEYVTREKDDGFRGEVEKLLARANDNSPEDWKELEDRFYQNLEFGTGGLRGVIGGGYNRMNTLVVKSATQGLANYIIEAFPEKAAAGWESVEADLCLNYGLSAVIAFDSRHYSAEFAEAAALIFAANGIKAWLFSSLRPTPELSFAIRRLNCDTGIVVTASHNPPAYNGYKAYWADGAQVIPPHDKGIISEVNAVTEIKEMSRQEAIEKRLLAVIDWEIDLPYQEMVRRSLFRPALFREKADNVKIVYTPLHGTGAFHVEGVLSSLGLKVISVPEQREGDGDFPTVAFPNPEEAAALDMAIKLAAKEKADVVMATDPDADRFGVAVAADSPEQCSANNSKDGFVLVTGNQMGALLGDYIFLSLKETEKMPSNPAMVNTIVTTGMHKRLAAHYGVRCFECLTGFKWIADIMGKCETDNSASVVFGTEESYGYLVENKVRDKDGISAAAMTAEMTLYWRSKGKSLLGRLEELYQICGYWEEIGISKYFQGPQGNEIMAGIMEEYRKNPPKIMGGIAVEKVRDLKNGADGLPPSDVIQFFLADGTVVSARPSGTEPKIKFYASCCAELGSGGLASAKAEASRKLAAIKQDIRQVIGD
jgi:phosphoglucomutase